MMQPAYVREYAQGYVYMNGDIGKLPQGAVYPASPEGTLGQVGGAVVGGGASGLDYAVMNGAPSGNEIMLETAMGALETNTQQQQSPHQHQHQHQQHSMGIGGGALPVGYAPVDMTSIGDIQLQQNSMGDLSLSGIPLEQLKQMLSSQLEYYFSRENLANDTYLLSQMDNDQYVPIWTVANFNQVKKLTKDIKLITEVLRESPNVQVDEEGQKVRPNHKRCIVILREIPDSTPLEDVKNLFSGEGCPRLISCEFAHNSSWYVTFESDEDAQKAYRFLREEVREFQGKPIMARIKAKPMNRLPIPPAPVPGVGAIKNGYRTPPPPPVYDPSGYPPGQQRFLYTNGTTMPQTTMPPYANQVHLYHQPFYPAGLMPWPHASPAYFDMAGVFTMNGITPHNNFKPHNRGFNPRSRNKHRNGPERGGGGGGGSIDGGGGMVQMGGSGRIGHTPKNSGAGPLLGPAGLPLTVTAPATAVAAPAAAAAAAAPPPPAPPLQAAAALTPSLPTAKSTSSYQTGTKFHSSHAVPVASEAQFVTSQNVAKGSSKETTNDAQSLLETQVQHSHPHVQQQQQQQQQPLAQLSQPQQQQQHQHHSQHHQQQLQQQQFPRHRMNRRTKDQETTGKGNNANSALPSMRESSTPASNAHYNRTVAQFDLEASAFPPLPGLDADPTKSQNPIAETINSESPQSQNRLSDVVKGTVKLKGAVAKEPQQHQQQQGTLGSSSAHGPSQQPSNTSRSTSPGSNAPSAAGASANASLALATEATTSSALTNATAASVVASNTSLESSVFTPSSNNPAAGSNNNNNNNNSNNNINNTTDSTDIALSTVTLTPPSSPDKSVKTGNVSNLANGVEDSTTTTKSPASTTATATTTTTIAGTKTLEPPGIEPVTRCDCDAPNPPHQIPHSQAAVTAHSAVTANATATALPLDLSRPSYAQVAQHSREVHCTKHKATEEKDGND